MKKLEQIERQEQKAREKITAMQAILKGISSQRTEQENLQIIQQVRALKLSRDELYAFLGSGELPPLLAGALDGSGADPEVIHSQNNRKRKGKQSDTPDAGEAADHEGNPDNPNPYGSGYNADSTDFESEGMSHES